jgi:hypothetical protein
MMNSNNGGANDNDVCSDADNVVASESRTQGCRLSQQICINSSDDKNVLFLLSFGLNHNNKPLFSSNESRGLSFRRLSCVLATCNKEYVHEIKRRASFFNIHPVPRPSN